MTATKPRRVRRLKVAAVVGAIALLVAGVVVAKRLRAADSADVDPDRTDESAWQKVMSGLSEGGETTVTMARQAFSLAFEQLPGVAVPAGPRDDIRSGSAALRMMVAHWDELTGHEQQTVISYLPSADSANTESGDGVVPSTEGALEDPRTQRAGMVVFASASRTRVTPGGPVRAPRDGPDDATRNTIAARFAELQASLEARSGASLTGAVELSFNTREIVADSAAYTLPHSAGQLVTYPKPPNGVNSEPNTSSEQGQQFIRAGAGSC